MFKPIVNLHNHFDYSVLDGAMKVDVAVATAVDLRQPAISMTDHGTMGGSYSLWKAATAAGIKPIIGIEAYVSPAENTLKSPFYFGTEEQRSEDNGGGGKYNHLTLLAMNDVGVANLFKLQYDAYSNGFYGKPRMSLGSIAQHSEGIICLTGCLGSRLQTHLKLQQFAQATDYLSELKDIFGPRLFIEIMDHGIPIEAVVNDGLIQLSKDLDIPLVATNDAHYATPDMADVHDTLLCVQTREKKTEDNRFRFEGEGYHLASSEEMVRRFHHTPSAVANTLRVADMVEPYHIFDKKIRLPQYSYNEELDLETLVMAAVADKDDTYKLRATYELEIINGQGYAGYFLTLMDLIEEWRKNGIRIGPGRGSAGGSLIAGSLGITSVDPIKYGLLFERFLNPERLSLPDIDTDIDDRKRDLALEIAREKFGLERVAQVVTYGSIGAKSAIRDSARALSYPQAVANQLVSLLPPPKFGRQPTLAELPKSAGPTEIVGTARRLEGFIRSAGIHASAVVISPDNLVDLIPTKIPRKTLALTTELTGEELEELGYVKFDFLGLSALGVIDECLSLCGHIFDDNFDDEETYAHLSTGDTPGIFQLEGWGMRKLLARSKPRTIEDVATVIALYRPGPMGANAHTQYADRKSGKARVEYPHPEFVDSLSDILSPTFGLVVFQEQILQSLAAVGGYTYATAGLIFDAMRKKDTAKMEAARPEYERRLAERGYSPAAVAALWDILVPFADYSFNKAHATAYAMTAYHQAYLKVHYPNEYFAALLSSKTDPEELAELVAAAYQYGVAILPPDINSSEYGWTVVPEGVRFGLGAIKGISKSSYAAVTRERPYANIGDYWERADVKALNLAVVTSLAKSGALDSLSKARESLIGGLETLVARAVEARKSERLWGSFWEVPASALSVADRQSWELETMGYVFSQPRVFINIERHLKVNEWEYINIVTKKYKGMNRLTFHLASGIYMEGPPINIELARTSLLALDGLTIQMST